VREREFAPFLFAIYSGYAFKMTELTVARQAVAHRGRRLEYFTIVWNGLEGLIAVAAGIVAGSIALVGFGWIVSLRSHPVPRCFGESQLMPMLRVENETKS
jgi:hypothetical protein